MAKVLRKIWGGIIEYEEDEMPFDIRSFNAFGKSALLWLEQSRSLHRAAVRLMDQDAGPKCDIDAPIALMLGAYAVETLLKMVIVGEYCDQSGMTFDSRHAREFLPTTHDLKDLLTRANLRTRVEDRELLGDLSRYSTWAGRYPIPLASANYSGPAIFENITPRERPTLHPTWVKYVPLYEKLHRLAVRKTFRGQITRTPRSKKS
ncbi:MAG TPA: hypothetical protein VKA03_04430 [Methylovirgula sp.]|nr:hypothetical protein [Methylovirgula sp.]